MRSQLKNKGWHDAVSLVLSKLIQHTCSKLISPTENYMGCFSCVCFLIPPKIYNSGNYSLCNLIFSFFFYFYFLFFEDIHNTSRHLYAWILHMAYFLIKQRNYSSRTSLSSPNALCHVIQMYSNTQFIPSFDV